MTTLVILQPSYLPWIGYFDQIRRADVFIYYDDVQFDKHGWRNRNRIKGPRGPVWLTVPVRHQNLTQRAILDVEIDNRQPWARKHVASLTQYYAQAPHTAGLVPELADLLLQPWQRLVDLNIATIAMICRWLDLKRPIYRSSELGVGGDRNQRLVEICRRFSADTYLSGNAAKAYLDLDLFAMYGIAVKWQDFEHPVYPQQHGEFAPYLSMVDMIFNAGTTSLSFIDHAPPR